MLYPVVGLIALLLVALPAGCQSAEDAAPEAAGAVTDATGGTPQPPGQDDQSSDESADDVGRVSEPIGPENALATLTAVAAAESGEDQGEGADDPVSQLPGVTSAGQVVPDFPGAVPGAAGEGDDPSAYDEVIAARMTEDARAGIANVDGLVMSMPPLATFTPAPGGPDMSGTLVYVRGGRFYEADASGQDRGELELEDDEMPFVWSPPDDPGRGWLSPDGQQLAFFAGSDAEMWMMDVDGGNNRAVSGTNLPNDRHDFSAGDAEQSIRTRPSQDYTLVYLGDDERPFATLVDDNNRWIRGEAKMRIVHGADAHRDKTLVAYVNGQPLTTAIAYGRASDNRRIESGSVTLELRDAFGNLVASLPTFEVADRELKTVFLYGDDELKATHFSYEPSLPPSGNARVRAFNATSDPVDVTIDGSGTIARGLAAGALGGYANVPAVMGLDERQDAELAMYGLRSGEEPVAWSPDGERVAYVGASDGTVDLYVASPDAPPARVTADGWREVNPRWSPDGKHLVWEALDESFDQHYIGLLREGQREAEILDLAPLRLAAGWGDSSTVVFPEGIDWVDEQRIYFYPQAESESAGIWTYDIESGALAQAYPNPITAPSYSREAEAWAFGGTEDAGDIYTLTADGALRQLPVTDAYYPMWSPEGEQISWVEGATTESNGWRLHVIEADGSNDRTLTERLPVLQEEPPVPGPNAKRFWLDGGERLAFTRAGQDYGAAERAGGFGGSGTAGDDIENVWAVAVDGESPPEQLTDLTKVFYVKQLGLSPDGDTMALAAFSYRDRSVLVWTFPADGGTPVKIDGPVRWYAWID